MAVIIDGSTHPKFWRIVPDNGTPTVAHIVPKGQLWVESSGKICFLSDTNYAAPIVTVDGDTVDENGNALNTVVKVQTYISDNS